MATCSGRSLPEGKVESGGEQVATVDPDEFGDVLKANEQYTASYAHAGLAATALAGSGS